VLSLLVGIAEARGLLDRHDPVAKYLPESPADRSGIRLLDLLQMRSGLEWVENGDITLQWVSSQDPLRFTLHEQRVIAQPGNRWEYSTADTHVLGACLQAAVGCDLLDYANKALFAPMGIHANTWLADPTGLRVGGSELFLAPQELAAVGELVLRGGRWDGRQVVPATWLDESTRAQADADLFRVHEPDGAYRAVDLPNRRRHPGEGYAWLWWRSTLADRPVLIAHGLGGQMVVVDPASDAVVVATYAVDSDDPEARLRSRFGLLNDLLLPALSTGRQRDA
jgi:CubicO group peptidase (beta-lactamase class C family)